MARRSFRTCSLPIIQLASAASLGLPPVAAAAPTDVSGNRGTLGDPSTEKERRFGREPGSRASLITSEADPQILVLMVTLNGANRGLAQFELIDQQLWASTTTLRDIGIAMPATSPALVRLAGVEGLVFRYNPTQQSLELVVAAERLLLTGAELNQPETANPPISTSRGLVFNYDVVGRLVGSRASFGGLAETRAFAGNAVIDTSALFQFGEAAGLDSRSFVRLDSGLSRSFPDERLTIRLGDSQTVASGGARALRYGGLQAGTNDLLQPYLITSPLPFFAGIAALPSKVDLFINGVRSFTGDLPPGPFEIGTGSTRINGAGEAQVVLTDALGRQTNLSYAIYDTRLLLRSGLSQWSASAGLLRRNYALRSFDYGEEPFFSGDLRHGITNRLTADFHAEATADFLNVGGGATWGLARYGVANASLAASTSNLGSGLLWNVGYSWTNSRFTLAADYTRAQRNFADLAVFEGVPFERERALVQMSVNTDKFGSFGASFVGQKGNDGRQFRFISLSWAKPILDDFFITLNGRTELTGERSLGIFASFTYAPGSRRQFGGSAQISNRNTSLSAFAREAAPLEGGLGWEAGGQTIDGQFAGFAQIEYQSDFGLSTAGAGVRPGEFSGFLSHQGSLVVADNTLFAARRINDSFAVVSTKGALEVPVLVHNREVGNTGSSGRLLVTGLNAYQRNVVAINPRNLPPSISVSEIERIAVPADRAGVVVEFKVERSSDALLTLVEENGTPVPVGSIVRYESGGPEYMVGYDGQLFLPSARLGERLTVKYAGLSCSFDLPGEFPIHRAGRLGKLVCAPVSGRIERDEP